MIVQQVGNSDKRRTKVYSMLLFLRPVRVKHIKWINTETSAVSYCADLFVPRPSRLRWKATSLAQAAALVVPAAATAAPCGPPGFAEHGEKSNWKKSTINHNQHMTLTLTLYDFMTQWQKWKVVFLLQRSSFDILWNPLRMAQSSGWWPSREQLPLTPPAVGKAPQDTLPTKEMAPGVCCTLSKKN